VAALLTYERIRTTETKAKEVRRLAERAITWARRLGPVLTKKPEKRTDEEKARVVHGDAHGPCGRFVTGKPCSSCSKKSDRGFSRAMGATPES